VDESQRASDMRVMWAKYDFSENQSIPAAFFPNSKNKDDK